MKPQDRTRAILRSKLEPSARLILIAIADHMDGGDSCWVRPETLAGETGLALSSVARWLADLQTAGLLRRWWNGHPCMDHAINWPALATFAPASTGKRGGARPRGPNTDAPNVGPPNIGGGSDYRSGTLRTSEADPPNIGEKPSEHRTRSVPEAIHEATNEATQGEPEGVGLTTPPTSDPAGSVPPADLTSATEAPYAPTADPTPEHVNETNAGDRAEEGDVPRVASGPMLGERGIYTPSPEAGLFGVKGAVALVPVVPAPTPPPEPAPTPKAKRAPKAKPTPDELADAAAEAKRAEESFHRSVTDQFGDAFREVFGTRYPWCFKGRDHDGTKRGVWIAQAKISKTDPAEGLARLRGAALAYCRAVEAGRAFPYGEPATTHHFTRDLAKWLQTDPNAPPRVNGSRQDRNAALLAVLDEDLGIHPWGEA